MWKITCFGRQLSLKLSNNWVKTERLRFFRPNFLWISCHNAVLMLGLGLSTKTTMVRFIKASLFNVKYLFWLPTNTAGNGPTSCLVLRFRHHKRSFKMTGSLLLKHLLLSPHHGWRWADFPSKLSGFGRHNMDENDPTFRHKTPDSDGINMDGDGRTSCEKYLILIAGSFIHKCHSADSNYGRQFDNLFFTPGWEIKPGRICGLQKHELLH